METISNPRDKNISQKVVKYLRLNKISETGIVAKAKNGSINLVPQTCQRKTVLNITSARRDKIRKIVIAFGVLRQENIAIIIDSKIAMSKIGLPARSSFVWATKGARMNFPSPKEVFIELSG